MGIQHRQVRPKLAAPARKYFRLLRQNVFTERPKPYLNRTSGSIQREVATILTKVPAKIPAMPMDLTKSMETKRLIRDSKSGL